MTETSRFHAAACDEGSDRSAARATAADGEARARRWHRARSLREARRTQPSGSPPSDLPTLDFRKFTRDARVATDEHTSAWDVCSALCSGVSRAASTGLHTYRKPRVCSPASVKHAVIRRMQIRTRKIMESLTRRRATDSSGRVSSKLLYSCFFSR